MYKNILFFVYATYFQVIKAIANLCLRKVTIYDGKYKKMQKSSHINWPYLKKIMIRALSDKTFGSRKKLKLNNAITIIGNFIT